MGELIYVWAPRDTDLVYFAIIRPQILIASGVSLLLALRLVFVHFFSTELDSAANVYALFFREIGILCVSSLSMSNYHTVFWALGVSFVIQRGVLYFNLYLSGGVFLLYNYPAIGIGWIKSLGHG